MSTTYSDLYLNIRRQLQDSGVKTAALDARELVCFATGKNRDALIRDGKQAVALDEEERVCQLVRRYLSGEPIAYLIGEWDFYGLPLHVSSDVLIPRPDTEVLVEEAIRFVQTLKDCRVLDLCAGSGCIGLAVASQVPQSHVILGEYSDAALHVCRQNISRTGLDNQVVPMKVNALEQPETALGVFHCIISNPPYIPRGDIDGLDVSVRAYEPHMALDGGEDGLDFYRSICQQWTQILLPGGRLYFEVGMGQAEDVRRLMQAQGLEDVQIVNDLHGIPRVVFATKRMDV